MAKSKWPEVQKKLAQVEKWARDGLVQRQIAKNLGISKQTMEDYKKRYPDFLAALKRGKEPFLIEIENAIAKRALGFKYEEKKVYKKEEDGKTTTYTEITEKQALPDVGACAFILKNRGKEEGWADNPQMVRLKQEELELRKQLEEAKNW